MKLRPHSLQFKASVADRTVSQKTAMNCIRTSLACVQLTELHFKNSAVIEILELKERNVAKAENYQG